MKLWASLVFMTLCLPTLHVNAGMQGFILPSPLNATASTLAQPIEGTEEIGDPDDQRARELFENGLMLYNEGAYLAAISAWEEAHRLSKRPLLLFNIANAYERLGDLEMALEALNRYRAFAPADERDVLERRIHSLSARLIAETAEKDLIQEEAEEPTPEAVPEITSEPPVTASEKEKTTMQRSPYFFGGVFVTSMGLGAALGLNSRALTLDSSQYCEAQNSGDLLCAKEAQEGLAVASRRAVVADGAFAIAIGAGIAGGISYMRRRDATSSPQSSKLLSLQPLFLRDGGGLALGGVF